MKKTIIIIFLILFSFTGFCQIPPKQITDYRETSDYIEGKKSLVKGTLYYAAGLACETAGLFMLLSEPKSNTTTALGGEKVTVVNYSTNYIGGIVCVSGKLIIDL